MVCEWFTWIPACDLPNWLALLIGGLIGIGIAAYFYLRQYKEKKKKQGIAVKRIADAYDMVNDQISVLEEIKKEYQEQVSTNTEKNDYQLNIEESKKWWKITVENLNGYSSRLNDYLDLFSEDLDQNVKAITNHLVSLIKSLKSPIIESKNIDFLDIIVDYNNHYKDKLNSIKPNPIAADKKDKKGFSDLMVKGMGLPTKDFIDHLYSGELNKK